MNIIKIFLASSSELQDDRKEFKNFISDENKIWIPKGIRLDLETWEVFIDAMSPTRLQDEYNKVIKDCDLFLMFFFTKVSKYTEEEFETAFHQFIEKKRPRVYTYFKSKKIEFDSLDPEDTKSLWAFREKL